MSNAKTSVFYLTERVTIAAANTNYTDTIDLGAYCDVADRQGLLIHSVDFITQGATGHTAVTSAVGGDGTIFFQLTDLNRGGLVLADDRALIASGMLTCDTNPFMFSQETDMFPDNFGPTSAQGGRIVINDQIYFTARSTAVASDINITVRIKASIITLSQKDFMAIALQSTAADN